VKVYPFIEAEKAEQRNVKRACELLEPGSTDARIPGGLECLRSRFEQGVVVCGKHDHRP
jgi:hypothetical protein